MRKTRVKALKARGTKHLMVRGRWVKRVPSKSAMRRAKKLWVRGRKDDALAEMDRAKA